MQLQKKWEFSYVIPTQFNLKTLCEVKKVKEAIEISKIGTQEHSLALGI